MCIDCVGVRDPDPGEINIVTHDQEVTGIPKYELFPGGILRVSVEDRDNTPESVKETGVLDGWVELPLEEILMFARLNGVS